MSRYEFMFNSGYVQDEYQKEPTLTNALRLSFGHWLENELAGQYPGTYGDHQVNTCGLCRHFKSECTKGCPLYRDEEHHDQCCQEWESYTIVRNHGGMDPNYPQCVAAAAGGMRERLEKEIRKHVPDAEEFLKRERWRVEQWVATHSGKEELDA